MTPAFAYNFSELRPEVQDGYIVQWFGCTRATMEQYASDPQHRVFLSHTKGHATAVPKLLIIHEDAVGDLQAPVLAEFVVGVGWRSLANRAASRSAS